MDSEGCPQGVWVSRKRVNGKGWGATGDKTCGARRTPSVSARCYVENLDYGEVAIEALGDSASWDGSRQENGHEGARESRS